MSERALVYSDEDFRHRILYIAEADALAGEGLSAYFLRTLVSEGRLVYETVEKDGDRLVTRVIEKPGPIGVILTTTRLHLHAENETRMLAAYRPGRPAAHPPNHASDRASATTTPRTDAPPEAW